MNRMETFIFAAINPQSGSLGYSKTYLGYGLAGIALAQLYRQDRITWDGKSVAGAGKGSAGDDLLDEILQLVLKREKPYRPQSLISTSLYRVPRLSKRVLERLEDNGMIRIEQQRFLGLIPYNRYNITRINEHGRLVKELKDIIVRGEKQPDAEIALLISMLSACGVLKGLFAREERKQVRETLKKINKGEYFRTLSLFDKDIQKSVRQIIAASNAAAGT